MKELILASHNDHKVLEMNAMLDQRKYQLHSLKDLNYFDEIIESGSTLEENARIKATVIHSHFKKLVISEDTGLEVDALNGAPGVFTARYAGPKKNANDNMDLLLQNLINAEHRGAQFRTIVCLMGENENILFEGICRGRIAIQKSGTSGFGYDPIFIPDGYNQTFAKLSSKIKNGISHRYKASTKLFEYLNDLL